MRATALRIQLRIRPLQQQRPRNYRAAGYRYRYRYFARARRGKKPRHGPILAMIPLASRPPASVCRAPGRGELFARRKPQTLPLGGYEQCNNSTQCWVGNHTCPPGFTACAISRRHGGEIPMTAGPVLSTAGFKATPQSPKEGRGSQIGHPRFLRLVRTANPH